MGGQQVRGQLLEREIASLEEIIHEAAEGRARVALIEGPAGIGKTRPLIEARRRAAEADRSFSAACHGATGGNPGRDPNGAWGTLFAPGRRV